MQNGDNLEKMYNDLKNSAGSADEEQARFMDSIEAKTNALKESIKGIWIDTIDSDSIKGILDVGTGGINVIHDLVSTFGLLPTAITTAVAGVSIFNSKFRETFTGITNSIPIFKQFNTAISMKELDYNNKFSKLSEQLGKVKASMIALSSVTKEETVANNMAGQSALGLGMKFVTLNGQMAMAKAGIVACKVATIALQGALTMGLSLLGQYAIEGISNIVNASENLKQKNKETVDSIKSSQQDVTNLEDLKKSYQDVQKSISEGNLTTEEATQKRERLNEKYKQLVNQIPELQGALDNENQSYQDNIKVIEQAIEMKRKQQEIDNEKYLNDNKVNDKGIDSQISKYKELASAIELYSKKANYSDEELMKSGDKPFSFMNGDKIREEFKSIATQRKQELLDMQKSLQEELTQINLGESLFGKEPVSEETKSKIILAIQDINNQLGEMGNINATDKVKDLYGAFDELNSKGEVSSATIDRLANAFPELDINSSNASDKIGQFGESLKNSVDFINSAMNELNSNGSLSEETISNLANRFPELDVNSSNASNTLSTLFNLISGGVGTVDDLADSMDGASGSADKFEASMKNLSETFDGFKSQADVIDKVIEEMGKYGGITESTYGTLISKHPEVLATLVKEGDTIENLTKLRDLDKQKMNETLQSAIATADAEFNHKANNYNNDATNKENSDARKVSSDTNANNQMQQNTSNTVSSNNNAYNNDESNFSNSASNKESRDSNFQNNWTTNTANSVGENSEQFSNENNNFSNLTSNKQENDSIFQNDWVNNTVNSVNSNSGNFDVEDSNYGNLTSNKSANDANFQNAWRVNTANTVNTLANHYKIDLENFRSITQAKQQLLMSFGQNLEKLGSAFSGASIGVNSTMNMMTNPWAIPDVGERNQFVQDTDKLLGLNNQLTAEFSAYQSGLSEIGSFFSNAGKQLSNLQLSDAGANIQMVDPGSAPTMVADGSGSGSRGSKGKSGGSGSKGGKSDTEKAQEEAEKFAKQIAETNSDLKFDRYFDLNNTIKEITNSLEDNKTVRESLTDTTLIQDSISAEVDLYKRKKDAIVDLKNEYVAEKEELREYLSKYSFQFDDEGQIINSQQRLKELQDSINAMGGNTEEALEDKKEWIEWLKDLSEKCKDFSDIVNDKIPDCVNQFKELGNSIKKIYEENLTDLRDQLIKGLEKDISDARKKAEDEDKRIYDEKIKAKDEEIKQLQDELDSLNDDSTDKKKKLEKLKNELNLWRKETNNVYSKSKQESLKNEILNLEKEIKKDDLQKQIDEKNKEKDAIEKENDDKVKATKELYDKMEEEGEKYARANKLLMEKNTTEIERLLELQSEKFKDIGRLWGQNLSDSFSSEIKGALDGIEYLKGGNGFTVNQASQSNNISKETQVEGNNTTQQPQAWSSNWIADTGDHVWIPKPQDTEVYSDTQGNGLGSAWNNGIGAGDELKVTDYDNGYVKIVNKSGQSWWIDRYKLNRWNDDISQFASGGRTPNNLPDSGALSILHKKEAILNANDTQKLDDIHEYVKSTSYILDKIDTNYNLLNNLNNTVSTIPNINPAISRLSNVTNNTNTDNSMIQEINNYFDTSITNNTKEEVMMNDRMFEQKMNKLMGKYGQNRHRR